jgi:hypothetical protein
VDYKNDQFIMHFSSGLIDKDPLRGATSDIAQYIRWIEHEYHYGNTSSLDRDKSSKDDGYLKRVSWLHRLVSALEISTTEISDDMRNMGTRNTEGKYGPIKVEESIKHFLQSWEVREERLISQVG